MKENENASSVKMQVVLSKMLLQISRAMQEAAEELSESHAIGETGNEVSIITVTGHMRRFLRCNQLKRTNRTSLEVLCQILFWLWKQPEGKEFTTRQVSSEFNFGAISVALQYLHDTHLVNHGERFKVDGFYTHCISSFGRDLVEGRL